MREWLTHCSDSALATVLDTYRTFHGYRIAWPNDPAKLAVHDALVQKIFFESGIFETPDTELAQEDEASICRPIMVTKARKAIAALTIVENPGILPVEEYFHFELPDGVDRKEVGEVTRYVIEHDQHLQNPIVSLGLLSAAWRYSTRQRQLGYWIFCFPSLFLWGMQSYFPNMQVIQQLPLKDHHVANREGRESYFDESRKIRIVLVELSPGIIINAARHVLKRRLDRDRNRRKRRRKKKTD